MRYFIYSTIILLVICSACHYPSAPLHGDENPKVKQVLSQLLQENEVPGISFALIHPSGKQEAVSVGLSDIKYASPLKVSDVMFSGSVGKTYAVALLMKLIDEGKVNVKDRFIDYFPEKDWLNQLPYMEDITIAQLLQHSSGLPRYVMQDQVWDSLKSNPDKVWSYYDRLSVVFNKEAVHPAGADWSYSDTNYLLLGMLIEAVYGQAYYDIITEELLMPLKLKATYAANHRDIPSLITGYSRLPDMFRMPKVVVTDGQYVFNPQMEWTGGGMASTTLDLARWAKYYFEASAFSKESLAFVTKPSETGQYIDEQLSCGSGSFVFHTSLGDAYGHTGFVPGFVSIFAYFPDHQMAVALQINCDYAKEKMSLMDYVLRVLKEGYGLN